METYNLTDPPRETLAKLAASASATYREYGGPDPWDAWRGAVALFAGIELSDAAGRAGSTAADFSFATAHATHLDLAGLRTDCERTANWLAKWLGRNVEGRDGDGNSLVPYVQTERWGDSDRVSFVAVFAQHKIGD